MTGRNVALILLLAAGIRALALWDDADSLLYRVGGLDAPQYLDMARRFTTGEWPGDKPFFWAPGYAVFLGLLSAISSSITWLKLAQVALGAASCALVFVLASRLFEDSRIALLSAAVAALYGPLVYYDLQISPASLDVFLWLSLLLLLIEAQRRERTWLWLAAGAAAAASAVTRGAALLLVPVVLIWMAWPPPQLDARVLRAHAARLAAFLAPVILVLTLVTRHNVAADRAWGAKARDAAPAALEASAAGGLFLSYNLGINFLLGNVAQLHAVNRVEHPLCLLNYKMLVFKPTLAGPARPSEQSRALSGEALAWMREHPGQWLRLLGTKALELVHGEEISRDTSIDGSRVDNRVLAVLLWKHGIAFPSGLLIPLALLGIALSPKRSRSHGLVLAAIATQALFVLAFFVTTRYRLALWASAIPYAAYAACSATDAARRGLRARELPGSPARLAGIALLAAFTFAISNRAVSAMPDTHAAFEHDHLGAMLDKEGEHERAAAQWRTALSIDPRYAQAHFQLANYAAKQGDTSAAAAHYRQGLDGAPTAFAARLAYASLLIRLARPSEATVQLRRVLEDMPSPRVRATACLTAQRAKLDLRPECSIDAPGR